MYNSGVIVQFDRPISYLCDYVYMGVESQAV